MIGCEEARDRLLDAGPDELAGTGRSDLSTHLAICAECGRLARRIVDDQEKLAAALRQIQPQPHAWAGLDSTRRRRRVVRRRGTAWFASALAAAAALVIVLIGGEPSSAPVVEPRAVNDFLPDVRFTTEADVVVMATENPNITVVWFY